MRKNHVIEKTKSNNIILVSILGFEKKSINVTEEHKKNGILIVLKTKTFQLKELEKRKIQLEGELVQLSPNAPVILATGEAVLGDADRLKALQTELRKAEAAYKEDHPTVVRLHREVNALLASKGGGAEREDLLEQLKAERDNFSALKNKYTDEHPEIAQSAKIVAALENALAASVGEVDEEPEADNPAYLVINTRLQATDEDIRVGQEKLIDLHAKVDKYEGYLAKAPQVEKEYQRLQRDYQNTYTKYQEIRAKQMSAELAKNLESEQKGERFTLIQPPELPIQPVSPNRVALVLLGAILAVGAGALKIHASSSASEMQTAA